MIHGLRNRLSWFSAILQKFNWTSGCIALTNSEMDEFMDWVNKEPKAGQQLRN